MEPYERPGQCAVSLIHRNAIRPGMPHCRGESGGRHAKKVVVALIAFAGALPAAAQQNDAVPRPRPIKIVGDAARGEALVTRWCTSCHRLPNDGTATDQAPTISWIAEQVQKDPNYIRVFLDHPHAPMPPLDLDRSEIEDAVAYFRNFGRP
jgi:cytochrome c